MRPESARMEVLIDEISLGIAKPCLENTNLWTLKWNSSTYSQGLHSIKVILSDESGKVLTGCKFEFSVDGTPVRQRWNALTFSFGLIVSNYIFHVLYF